MGVKGSCRSANRGGCPSFMPFQYSTGIYFVPAFILSGRQFSAHRGKFSAKQGKSEFFFGVLWCFLGKIGDQKGQNTNIFLKYGAGVSCRVLLWWWCPLVAYVPDSGPAGPVIGRLWSSCGVFHAFCPLVCFACGALRLNMALFRVLRGFLEGFMVRMNVCMG